MNAELVRYEYDLGMPTECYHGLRREEREVKN